MNERGLPRSPWVAGAFLLIEHEVKKWGESGRKWRKSTPVGVRQIVRDVIELRVLSGVR